MPSPTAAADFEYEPDDSSLNSDFPAHQYDTKYDHIPSDEPPAIHEDNQATYRHLGGYAAALHPPPGGAEPAEPLSAPAAAPDLAPY